MSEPSFLDTEYQMCFEQLRYYDTRQEELLKYLFTVTSATATAQFAVLQFLTYRAPLPDDVAESSVLCIHCPADQCD